MADDNGQGHSKGSRKGPTAKPASLEAVLDRQPPCNLEAERAVLGSILLLPQVCDEVALAVRPEDFYDDANARIYAAILKMHDTGRKVDAMLLVETDGYTQEESDRLEQLVLLLQQDHAAGHHREYRGHQREQPGHRLYPD